MGKSRPDMTFAVNWTLNNNYLSIHGPARAQQQHSMSPQSKHMDEAAVSTAHLAHMLLGKKCFCIHQSCHGVMSG